MIATFEFHQPEQAIAFEQRMLGVVGVNRSHRVVDVHAETLDELGEAQDAAEALGGKAVPS